MKNFIKWLKSLFKKEKPVQVTPPVVTPPVVTPPVVTPPVVTPPVVTPPVVVTPYPVTTYPKQAKIMGVNIMLNAPIHELWQPSMEAHIFGGQPNTVVGDPSNAPKGYPNRTPNGFPIHYGGVHWDTVKQEWVGTPMAEWGIPFGGVVLFPQGKSDMQTVIDHLAAVKIRDDNSKENDRITAATRWLGPIPAGSLSDNDLAWLYYKNDEFRDAQVQATGRILNGDIWRTVLGGMHVDIARAINNGEDNHARPGSLTPENKELEAIVEAAIASAKAGTPPPQQSTIVT